MGSLAGHVLPGAIFIFYGISWIALSFWLHLTTPTSTSGHKKGSYSEFKRESKLGRVSYIPQPFCSKIPLEPVIKILLSCIGIVCEAFADFEDGRLVLKVMKVYDDEGSLRSVSKLHHITMYGAFLVSGVVDLIGLVVRIPRNMSKLFFSLAFFIEGLLFWYHTHDKEHLSIAIHGLLIVIIFITLFLSLLRILQPSNVIINSLIGSMLLVQGTWFIQIGAILYQHNPVWSTSDESSSTDQIMFAVVIFNWHVLGNMLITLIAYILMLAIFRGSIKYKRSHGERGKRPRWTLLQQDEHNQEQQTNLLNKPLETKDTIL